MKLAILLVLVSCSDPPRPPPEAPKPEVRAPEAGPASGVNAVADVLTNARKAPAAWDGKRIEVVGKVIVGAEFSMLVDPDDETRGLVVRLKGPPPRERVTALTCTVHVEPGPDRAGIELVDCL